MRDIVHNMKIVASISPADHAASVEGSAVDLLGFNSAALLVSTGEITGDGDMSIKLQESDTTVSGDFTDVAAQHLQGSIEGSLDAHFTEKVGYRGFKRYLRAVLRHNGGTSVIVGAWFHLGHASERPVA